MLWQHPFSYWQVVSDILRTFASKRLLMANVSWYS